LLLAQINLGTSPRSRLCMYYMWTLYNNTCNHNINVSGGIVPAIFIAIRKRRRTVEKYVMDAKEIAQFNFDAEVAFFMMEEKLSYDEAVEIVRDLWRKDREEGWNEEDKWIEEEEWTD